MGEPCSRRMRFRRHRIVLLGRAAYELGRLSEQLITRELGGVLIGYRRGRDVVVVHLAEVRDDSASFTSYTRDSERAQDVVDAVLTSHPDFSLSGYVGEWHTHPLASPPSRQDLAELRAVARLSVSSVALLVVSPANQPTQITARGWVATGRLAREARVEVSRQLNEPT